MVENETPSHQPGARPTVPGPQILFLRGREAHLVQHDEVFDLISLGKLLVGLVEIVPDKGEESPLELLTIRHPKGTYNGVPISAHFRHPGA